MFEQQLDRLDAIAEEVRREEDLRRYGPLPTEARLYVALAANRVDLLINEGYTIAQALDRLGQHWTEAFIGRWSNR